MLKISLLIAVITLLEGCGHFAVSSDAWPKEYLSRSSKFTPHPTSPIQPLVIVRLPTAIAEIDYPSAIESYGAKRTSDGMRRPGSQRLNPLALQSALLRSLHHGLALSKCLMRQGEQSFDVLVEPTVVGKTSGEWRHLSPPRPLPATIVVDVLYYVSGSVEMMKAGTFADVTNPYFTVRTSPVRAPATQGAIAVSAAWFPIMGVDPNFADKADARAGMGASLPEFIATPGPSGDFSNWHSQLKPKLSKELQAAGARWKSGAVLTMPSLYIKTPLNPQGYPISDADMRDNCTAVMQILNDVLSDPNLQPAESARLASYVASLHGERPSIAQSSARTALVPKLYAAEVKLLKAQDERLVSTVETIDTDKLVADARVKERDAGVKYDAAQWSTLLRIAGSTATSLSTRTPVPMSELATQQSMVSNATAEAGTRLGTLANFYSTLKDFSSQVVVEGQTIAASSHLEFRQKLLDLLERR